ncbi:MAG: 3'(2'),5'-bisphosphate nucleotidase CysQ [Bacteroidales bacterium]|nr:3'(2'),5'-bisphosphate nucleotidase CysQ [Bacteroides sp.]NLI64795.1 3'(2'),5'-bisphosphate nucleotidase CysQ [Bacteroidales bacterium]
MENKDKIYLAIDAALNAGKAIRKIYNKPTSGFEIEKKEDNSPLTLADREAHKIIMNYLKQTPYPILSEEGKLADFESRSDWKSLWIVDPLDGTKEFIKRNGEFTVNIAWVENQKPVIGVIYVPVSSKLYFSDLSLGAYCIESIQSLDEYTTLDDLINVSNKLPLEANRRRDEYVVVASRSHLSEEVNEYIKQLKEEGLLVKTVSVGSSLKFCLIAEGSADCYPRFTPTMEWDTAAGHAIVLATGSDVLQLSTNEPLLYNKQNLINPFFLVKNTKI